MTMDRRFPGMCRIEDAPPETRRWVREVCSRCFVQAAWMRARGRVHFYRDDPAIGVAQEPDRLAVGDSIDRICQNIQYSTMPAERKDRLIAESEKALEDESNRKKAQDLEDRRSDTEHFLKYARDRRGMHKGYQRSVLVNGLKQENAK